MAKGLYVHAFKRLSGDRLANVFQATDWSGFVANEAVQTGYDAGGRKTSDVLLSGGSTYAETDYGYDTVDRLSTTTVRMFGQGSDRVTLNGYDVAGQITSVTTGNGTPEVSTDKTTYTLNGMISSVTDGQNNRTDYVYDGFDRLVRTHYPVTAQGQQTANPNDYQQITYDANGDMTTLRLRDGTSVGYTYDALNRVTQMTPPASSNPDDTTTRYSYDNLGHLTLAAKNAANQTHFTWDALGRKTSESNYYYSVASQYDPAGRRTRLTWHDGFYVTYEYNAAGEMAVIRENGSTVLASFGYDDLGRRTSLSRANGVTTGYAYDPVSRLSTLTQDIAGTAGDLSVSFGYNPAGQITSRTSSNDLYAWPGAVNVDRSYSVNGLNQYTASGSVTPTYDARGNLTSAGPQSYQYTSSNRMWNVPGVGVLYGDSLDRLDYIGAENLTIGHDGPDAVAEMALTTCCSTQLAITRRYVFGPGADEPLVWYEGSGTSDKRWLMADERGSVIAVTNSVGNAIDIKSYDEYGIPHDTTPANAGRFGYTGQMWLPSLGMNYYKARMYSPTLGRFMQTDPIGYADGMNMYDYVGGDPINKSDPSGLSTCPAGSPANQVCTTAPSTPARTPSRGSGFSINPIPIVKSVICLFFGCNKKKTAAPMAPAPASNPTAAPQKEQQGRPDYCRGGFAEFGKSFSDIGDIANLAGDAATAGAIASGGTGVPLAAALKGGAFAFGIVGAGFKIAAGDPAGGRQAVKAFIGLAPQFIVPKNLQNRAADFVADKALDAGLGVAAGPSKCD